MHLLKRAFERFAPGYIAKFEDRMLPSHRAALRDIMSCQTADLGGSRHLCNCCGHEQYVFHSCRNRSCYKCHHDRTEQWLTRLQAQVLPVPHFHLVFTLPSELRSVVQRNQRALYKVLMTAAFDALQKLAYDKQQLGGRVGAIAVLHTWSGSMDFHPHVHMMIPAGAVSGDSKKWIEAKSNFLVHIESLKSIFRGIFMKKVRQALPDKVFPQSIWKKNWSIHCNRFDSKVEHLLNYLGRYIYRIAISNNRIISVDDKTVTINNKGTPVKLQGQEFIHRYLMHVLPKGFHKVRYFGIMHPSQKPLRNRIKLSLLDRIIDLPERVENVKDAPSCSKCSSRDISIHPVLKNQSTLPSHRQLVPP